MKRIVVKVGTGNLVSKQTGNLNPEIFTNIAEQISGLRDQSQEVILVTSGAIKAGTESKTLLKVQATLKKREWAGIGARYLLDHWGSAFKNYGYEIAQVWVTHADLNPDLDRTQITESLTSYLQAGIIPVVNENDVVSDSEIKSMELGRSENDRLARIIAEIMQVDGVLFLTDIGGVYDSDPRINPDAKMLPKVDVQILNKLSSSVASTHGTGGIKAKIISALACSDLGIRAAIAGLDEPDVIRRFAQGEHVGTMV